MPKMVSAKCQGDERVTMGLREREWRAGGEKPRGHRLGSPGGGQGRAGEWTVGEEAGFLGPKRISSRLLA